MLNEFLVRGRHQVLIRGKRDTCLRLSVLREALLFAGNALRRPRDHYFHVDVISISTIQAAITMTQEEEPKDVAAAADEEEVADDNGAENEEEEGVAAAEGGAAKKKKKKSEFTCCVYCVPADICLLVSDAITITSSSLV